MALQSQDEAESLPDHISSPFSDSFTSSMSALDRSPQPYARLKSDLTAPTAKLPPSSAGTEATTPFTPSRDASPSPSDGEDQRDGGKWTSGSESGTEADDESLAFIKALPAPQSKPRKGLRGGHEEEDGNITTTHLDREVIRLSDLGIPEPGPREPSPEIDEQTQVRARAVRRRRGEILRRSLEGALLVACGALVLFDQGVYWRMSKAVKIACLSHAILLACVYAVYPLRLIHYSWTKTAPRKSMYHCIRLSAGFDPAPYIYPTILPSIVALSLYPTFSNPIIPNLVLGLSAIPRHVVSRLPPLRSTGMSNWLISVIPVLVFEHFGASSALKSQESWANTREVLATLYPLHRSLLPVLHSITTTSLLPAELDLLSISLINLLILATSPQAQILASILWVGGLGIIIFCSPVVRWGVAIARIPRWRLKRVGRIIQARQSFIKALNTGLERKQSRRRRQVVDSDADDDFEAPELPRTRTGLKSLKDEVLSALHNFHFFPNEAEEPMSAYENPSNAKSGHFSPQRGRTRSNTLPANNVRINSGSPKTHHRGRRRRARTVDASFFLSLTPRQAALRKWFYAAYLYVCIAILILGPIRLLVARTALYGAEPFGWALGYLLGDVRDFRFWAVSTNLTTWIPLPALADSPKPTFFPLSMPSLRLALGPASTRLLLCLTSLTTLALGLLTVLSLPRTVEVDTRRKVFHGTIVAILLPTIYIDPTFFSLALALVLSAFLLLDLLRASTLPPLSHHIASFLSPYVDGRDNRGPVVISHIFLLIGCAVPLWLSLAGTSLSGTAPWRGWEASTRDVSMLSGVVCVGMGDAAASLIGRRWGRHKLPWSGGKSLEGSLAFAGAVACGLVGAKVWLWVGGWEELSGESWKWLMMVGKTGIAACGASLSEAVLTGGNDNVVVPVVLWVLVRSLRL